MRCAIDCISVSTELLFCKKSTLSYERTDIVVTNNTNKQGSDTTGFDLDHVVYTFKKILLNNRDLEVYLPSDNVRVC